MPTFKRVIVRWMGGLVLVIGLASSPAALAGENPIPSVQSRDGSGMGTYGSNSDDAEEDNPTQQPISRPITLIFINPDELIFLPPLTETP